LTKNHNFLPVDYMVLAYNIIVAVSVVIFQSRVPNWPLHLAFNLSIIGFVLCISRGPLDPPTIFMKIIRRWYFLILLLFIYQQTGGLVFLYIPHWLDNGLALLEHKIFGVHPTLFLQKFNISILNEYFMCGYFAYFPIILSYALILVYKKKYFQMDMYITAVSMVFLICFFTFYFFPIAGPRFLFKGLYDGPLTGWLFVPMVDYVIKNGAAEGGSMPSSHTGAAIVILVYALRHERLVGYIYAPIVLGLVIGTFWGRFHFISDTIVGFFVAIACIMITDWLVSRRKFGSKHIEELSPEEFRQKIIVSK
jgi:membrane-associated phospholipid phosphatase